MWNHCRGLFLIQKEPGRQQNKCISASCPRALDLSNTCPLRKVTLACGGFPYWSRALPAWDGVSSIHRSRQRSPEAVHALCPCVCVCRHSVCVVSCVLGSLRAPHAPLRDEAGREKSVFISLRAWRGSRARVFSSPGIVGVVGKLRSVQDTETRERKDRL